MQVYNTVITNRGASASEFLSEGMIVLFKNNAPDELAEFSILHEENNLDGEIETGNTIAIGDHFFKITAVGSAVEKNLYSLGHITIHADGSKEAELPGTLYVEEGDLPDLQVGDSITITK
ncbi:PTS system glucitol/sorbitol-specific IIA component [Geomicrobium halophilum]|uniref:PTS system glucitol/sorbitol-specific IIA component n=1 Tax=Geomicrobium halophilum TaxID=549000 RepID=A0A841Q0Y0_9BACL|nr:PTS glucitol/sorbitol transporter subunit IIA [Geomicrobium halophilum]MBB6451115.1 PTS system glucitol/sorbitol-specific IIA component [Geomicrobium halophilum]